MTETEILNRLLEEYNGSIPGEVVLKALREERDASPEEVKMRERMEKFKPLFEDMVTPENAFSYDDIILRCEPKEYISHWSAEFRPQDFSINFTFEAWNSRPALSLLHEMTHIHEYVMTDAEKERCKSQLSQRLSGEIPDLEIILEQAPVLVEKINPDFDDIVRSAHDDLFLLKTFDIDQHFKRYKLGKVGGYDFAFAIELIRIMIANGTIEENIETGFTAFFHRAASFE